MKVWWGRVTPRAANHAAGRVYETQAPGPTGGSETEFDSKVSPNVPDLYAETVRLKSERAALVAWLREQHAEAVKEAELSHYLLGSATINTYRRVLERLGEKP